MPAEDDIDAVALAELQESIEDLYEDAPCGYLTTAPDGTVLKVNRTFEKWTGHRREDLVGRRRFEQLLAPGARIYHETHYAPLLRMQGSVREIAIEIVCADGRRLPALVNSVLRRDAAGEPRVVRTTVFDATDRRRYERELLAERDRAERLQREAALLAETSHALDEAPSPLSRIERLADVLVPSLADAVAVVLGTPGIGEGRTHELRRGALPPAADAALEEALASGRPQLAGRGTPPAGDPEEARVAALPLRARGTVVGAVVLARKALRAGLRESDLPLLEAVAARAALSLENARLYEEAQAVAHGLQRSMLPEAVPTDPRLGVATHYAPAVATLEVGGDWYDAFLLPGDRMALVVGDVVGRGLPAASAMGQIRSAVRALAGTQLGPAQVLQHLDAFVEHVERAMGATLVYAEIDLATGRMQYACAGHPPPVLAPPHDAPALLWEGRSPPLGAHYGSGRRAEAETVLPAGARLLLYTDGLIERRDRLIDRGLELLTDAFARRRGAPLGVLVHELPEELLIGQRRADDVCLLCVEFGTPPTFARTIPARTSALAALRADLRTWLDGVGADSSAREMIVLAVSEAAANAVEHGYAERTGDVTVQAALEDADVVLEVRDEGRWRDESESGVRGRGLRIVAHVMDAVDVLRGQGTTVRMRRRLTDDGGGA